MEPMSDRSHGPRILMIGPGLDVAGGISSVVNHWIAAGLRERVDLRYVATLDAADARFKPRKLWSALRAYAQVATELTRRRPDVVHIHLSSGASFWRKLGLQRLAQWRGVPTVVHLHGSTFDEFHRRGGPGRARRITRMFEDAHTVLVLSRSWERFVRDVAPASRIRILHNGAALTAHDATLTAVGGSAERGGDGSAGVVIAAMGRLGDRKGTWDLLEAFGRLAERIPGARLVLGGDGETEEAMRRAARAGLAERVEVLGWVSGARKLEVFARADIYALPSYHEGLPASILEAMAAGKPVVSTPVGGIPEAVEEGVTGFLVAAGDVDALHDRLLVLAQDRALRERLGRAGRERVEQRFDAARLLDQLADVYRGALEPAGPSQGSASGAASGAKSGAASGATRRATNSAASASARR